MFCKEEVDKGHNMMERAHTAKLSSVGMASTLVSVRVHV